MKRLSAKARHEALYEISLSSNILGFRASSIEMLFDDYYTTSSYAQRNLNAWEIDFAVTIRLNAYELLGNENDADEIRNNVDITNCYNLSLITITGKKAIRLFRKAIVNYIKYEVLGWEREEQTVSEPETETTSEEQTVEETVSEDQTATETENEEKKEEEEMKTIEMTIVDTTPRKFYNKVQEVLREHANCELSEILCSYTEWSHGGKDTACQTEDHTQMAKYDAFDFQSFYAGSFNFILEMSEDRGYFFYFDVNNEYDNYWETNDEDVEETVEEYEAEQTASEVTTAAETVATPATVSAPASDSIPESSDDEPIVVRTRIESTGHGVTITTDQGDKICYSHPMPDRDKCREGTEQTVTEVASLVVNVTKELFVAAEQELGHYPLAWALTHGWDVTKPLTLPPKFRNAGTQIDHRHYGEVVQNYRMAVDIEDLYALADYYLTYDVWTVCEITDEVRAKTREQVRLLTEGLEEGCVLADREAINDIREIPLHVLSGMLMCRNTFPDRYADAVAEITAIKLEICERVPVAYDLVADVWNSDLEDGSAISALLAFAKAELDIDVPQSPRADGMDWQNTAEQVLDRAWEDYYNKVAYVAHDVMDYVTELRSRV